MLSPKSKRLSFFTLHHQFRNYSFSKARADLKAAINVSLLDFPQGMVYALVVGVPVYFGLYASAVSSLLGPFFASSRHLILGPTNATSVVLLSAFLTVNIAPDERIVILPLIVLMVGLFLVIGALLKLGEFVKFISRTVIVGYITSAALLIVVNQLDNIMGIDTVSEATFFAILHKTLSSWEHVRWESLLIATVTLLTFYFLRKSKSKLPNVAVSLLVASVLTYALREVSIIVPKVSITVPMLRSIPFGQLPFSVPVLDFERLTQLAGAALGVAFLCMLESASIAKTLAARSGSTVDLNQQMLSLGMANLGCAFSSSLPASGSISRSSLNYRSGAQTGISSIISGVIIATAIFALGPYLSFVPRAALSALVIVVGIDLIDLNSIKVVIKSTRTDASVFILTLFAGLVFPLHVAIFLGAAASIVLFLQRISEPQLVEYSLTDDGTWTALDHGEKSHLPEVSIVHVEGELFFASNDIFLEQMRLLCESPESKVVILKLRNANILDASSALALKDLIMFASEHGSHVIISGASAQVERVFRLSGVMDILGEENFFAYVPSNSNLAMAKALARTKDVIGSEDAEVTLLKAATTATIKTAPEDEPGKATA